MKRIDLNCDMGESYGAWKMGADAEVMPFITSANIACGFHGGDPATIRKTVRLAIDKGVAIGAHPSLPDLQGFGRRVMKISPQEMYDLVVYQAGAVEAFARAAGSKLHHVKCHGALYNMAATDEALSEAMVRAAKDLGSMLYVLSNSRNYSVAKRMSVPVAGEVFADRGYSDDGTLAPRDKPGGMNDWHFIHLGHLSYSGAGLMMVEATHVTREGRITHGCTVLYSEHNEASIKRVIDTCRRWRQMPIGIQIGHAGRKASSQVPWEGRNWLTPEQSPWETVAPSPIAYGEGWHTPRELSKDEIHKLLEAFVSAAIR